MIGKNEHQIIVDKLYNPHKDWYGRPLKDYVVYHIDGNPRNHHLSNLILLRPEDADKLIQGMQKERNEFTQLHIEHSPKKKVKHFPRLMKLFTYSLYVGWVLVVISLVFFIVNTFACDIFKTCTHQTQISTMLNFFISTAIGNLIVFFLVFYLILGFILKGTSLFSE